MTADARVQFERDFDRAIFSTPVKRLQDKAQVFPLEPHDAIRTRLTHSLEVSSVARGLATSVGKWLTQQQEIESGREREIEAIAATCGLIHDLGNPPFGHAGEDAIQDWFKLRDRSDLIAQLGNDEQKLQDFLRFDGNAQTVRLVSKLQILADFNGLNLTFGTLSALCKYISPSNGCDGSDPTRKKPGFFASENSLIEQIRDETGTGDNRNPITFLVEAADDIVYIAADIEDAIKKGILTWEDIKQVLLTHDQPNSGLGGKLIAIKDRILTNPDAQALKDFPQDAHGSAFRTAAIAILLPTAADVFQNNYSSIMNGTYNKELLYDGLAASLANVLKDIAPKRIFRNHSILKLELMGHGIIHDLMEIFWRGASELSLSGSTNTKTFGGRAGTLLSQNYRDIFCHHCSLPNSNEMYCRYQLVTDYVCGMTDSFARRLHAELKNG